MIHCMPHLAATPTWAVVFLATFLLSGAPTAARAEPGPRSPDATPGDLAPHLEPAGPLSPFDETCFGGFHEDSRGLGPEEAARWLEPVEGRPLQLAESSNTHGRGVSLTGLARLRPPWVQDAVLRLSLYSDKPFKLHLLGARQGVTLCCYGGSDGPVWAAYRTTRRPGEPMMIGGELHDVADTELALLATDGGRSGRTPSGTCALRYQDGALVMTQGDVRLMKVPLTAPPAEVYLEGESALLRELAMFRGEPAPEEPLPARHVVLRGQWPASLHWQENAPPGAALKRWSDGRVELVANNTDAPAWDCVPLIRSGLYEVVLEVEDPSPGTGVYLGDQQGRPLSGIGFFRDQRTGLTAFGHDRPLAAPATTDPNLDTAPAPYAGRRQWLRLVMAGSKLKCFTSGDGVHWGEALPPQRDIEGPYTHVGLYARQASGLRSIKLRQLLVRRLDALTSLVPAALLEQADALGPPGHGDAHEAEKTDFAVWQQRVWENEPPGVDRAAWRRACAIVSLARGTAPPLTNALIDGLIEDGLSTATPLEAKLRLLQDAALAYDARTADDAARFLAHFERLGRAALRERNPQGFDAVRRVAMDVPLRAEQYRVEWHWEELARDELIARVYRERWDDVYQLCRQMAFYGQPAKLKAGWPSNRAGLRELVPWANDLASRRLPGQPGKDAAAVQPGWQHPLIVRLSKEAYNIQAEMWAALREGSVRTASEILASAAVPQDGGLVSDVNDRHLYEPLPTAVALAMREHPRLRQMMNERFQTADRLRLQQAVNEANAAAIRAATVQYFGTPAAAEACGWLGDELMASGQFGPAIGRYQWAMPMATPAQKTQLAARVRLAAAMLGHARGEPVTEPVEFCDTPLTAPQFEQLVAEMHQARAGDAAAVMIITNGSHVVAFDPVTGKPKWTYASEQSQQPSRTWWPVPLDSQVANGRVYLRPAGKPSPSEIVCLDAQSGQRLWVCENSRPFVSDPLLVWGHPFALTVDPSPDQPISRVMLASLDPESGAVQSERPLLELRDRWEQQYICQMTAVDDRIVAAVAGSLLCCDMLGQLHWVRQDTRFPPDLDPAYARRPRRPPLIAGDRVYAVQPGVRSIVCAELQTGRLYWRSPLPDVRRLLEVCDDRLLIETDEGISALAAQTGNMLWHHAVEYPIDGYLGTGASSAGREDAGGALYLRREPAGAELSYPVLIRLDLETGRVRQRSPLWDLLGEESTVGPLLVHDHRLWSLAGVVDDQGALRPQQQIIELIAASRADADDPVEAAAWRSSVDPSLRCAAEKVLPGWTLLSGERDQKTGLRSELTGAPDVMVTRAASTPVRLMRRVRLSGGGTPRLMLEIGHDPASRSKLEIRAGGLPLLQTAPEPTPSNPTIATDQWQRLQINLSAYAGRDAWITIVQEQAGDAPAYMYWKRAEVTP